MAKWKTEWLGALMLLFGRNWITVFGASVTTVSAFLIITFLVVGLIGRETTPYVGIMAFLILPMIFVLGLLIIPIGAYWQRRRDAGAGQGAEPAAHEPYPTIDFNSPRAREAFGVVAFLTAINLFIISTVSYKGVIFMDSVEFCGAICHTVMEPEYAAYLDSPHARVECVECHIGPGAPWFVRAKLSGVGQVFAVALSTYRHPIPAPVENLRPSRETCEQCHWPEKFTGDRVKVVTKFSDDEANTPVKTVLLMHIDGSKERGGIHSWHNNPNREINYIAADRQRQEIPWVSVKEADGTITEYVAEGSEFSPELVEEDEVRVMDCIDCHNRPTHIFRTPTQAMDQSIAAGRIDPSIPFIKRVGVEALEATQGQEGDLAPIGEYTRAYYRENHSEFYISSPEPIEAAIGEMQAIHRRNVFPGMEVTWGMYPDNIGHVNFPGCFRCHDDSHTSEDGKIIRQDCTICHTLLAWEEEKPDILEQLGID